MYPIRRTEIGYSFNTSKGVQYDVYFALIENSKDYFPENIFQDNYFYFGIERTSKKEAGKDIFIRRTITFIIVTFFLENKHAVLIFNYTNADKRLIGRRRLFYKWFEEFSEHTLYQYYQHDFASESTVCALFRREGGKDFESIRNHIRTAIINFENSTKI